MEYLYLNVHDEDRDDQTRCNVWILDGDPYHKGLLKFSLDAISLKDTLVMLVVDMSKPWTALDSLQKWASVVREHIDKLKIPPEEMKEMEQKLVRDFQEYVEPGEDFPASLREEVLRHRKTEMTVCSCLWVRTRLHRTWASQY